MWKVLHTTHSLSKVGHNRMKQQDSVLSQRLLLNELLINWYQVCACWLCHFQDGFELLQNQRRYQDDDRDEWILDYPYKQIIHEVKTTDQRSSCSNGHYNWMPEQHLQTKENTRCNTCTNVHQNHHSHQSRTRVDVQFHCEAEQTHTIFFVKILRTSVQCTILHHQSMLIIN